MGMFSNLMGKIFSHAVATVAPVIPSTPSTPATPSAPAPQPASSAPANPTTSPSMPAPDAPVPATTSAPASQPVDVTAILNGLAAKNSEHLDWKKSIVDLLKLVDMDSSLSARKELAGELGYSGDHNDSGAMNVWLHKAVLTKLVENGGKVPAELLN